MWSYLELNISWISASIEEKWSKLQHSEHECCHQSSLEQVADTSLLSVANQGIYSPKKNVKSLYQSACMSVSLSVCVFVCSLTYEIANPNDLVF